MSIESKTADGPSFKVLIKKVLISLCCSKQHSRANTIFNFFFMTLAKGTQISGEECDLADATLCGGAKRGSLQHSCYEQHVINHKALIASVVNLAEIFHSKTTS